MSSRLPEGSWGMSDYPHDGDQVEQLEWRLEKAIKERDEAQEENASLRVLLNIERRKRDAARDALRELAEWYAGQGTPDILRRARRLLGMADE